MSACPHVARFRDRVEPTGVCGREDAIKRVQAVRAVLRLMAVRVKHPGLVGEHAIDSIGKYLDPTHPEPARARLMGQDGNPDPPKVMLKTRLYETLFVADAELLDDRTRTRCIPLRGANEVARRLDPSERSLAELTVVLESGAKVVLRQHPDQLRAIVTVTSCATPPKRKTLDAALDPDQKLCLARCFEGAGRGVLSAVREESIAPRRIETRDGQGRGFWELPCWMAENVATVAQDLFRLHVLCTASSPNASRFLFVDRCVVHRLDDPVLHQDNPHTLIKATLHKASGGCLCGLHRKESKTEFARIEFRIKICDCAFVEQEGVRVCPKHYARDAPETHQAVEAPSFNAGRCAQALQCEVWCVHDRAEDAASGLRIPLPIPKKWMRAPLLDLAACACALTRPGNQAAAKLADLKATMDGVMQELDRTRMVEGHVESALQPWDITSVFLFRNDNPTFGTDKKLRGKCVRQHFQEMGASHGHLFKRARV